MPRGALVVLSALLLTISCMAATERATPRPSGTGDPLLWRTNPAEPYAFVTPVPPVKATAADGTYHRDFTPGSRPIPCQRCAPYRLDRGLSTLELAKGRFEIFHKGNGFRTSGHYLVEDDRLILLNDPVCPETRGVYRWSLQGPLLTLDELEDPCPFDALRARYLSVAPWEAVYGAEP